MWSLCLKPGHAAISHGSGYQLTSPPTVYKTLLRLCQHLIFPCFQFCQSDIENWHCIIFKMWISLNTMNTEDFFYLYLMATGNCFSLWGLPVCIFCLFVPILTKLIRFLSQVPCSADCTLFHAMLCSHLYLSWCLKISNPTSLFPLKPEHHEDDILGVHLWPLCHLGN